MYQRRGTPGNGERAPLDAALAQIRDLGTTGPAERAEATAEELRSRFVVELKSR